MTGFGQTLLLRAAQKHNTALRSLRVTRCSLLFSSDISILRGSQRALWGFGYSEFLEALLSFKDKDSCSWGSAVRKELDSSSSGLRM